MSTTPRRRRALMGATAFVTTAALSFLGLSVPAYAAPGDNSQALAQFLGSDLLASQLLDVGTAESSSPGGPASETNPLNLAALQALGLRLQVVGDGLEVPLVTAGSTPGLLTLGQLGVVQNYAASGPNGSVAASGLIGNDGTIAVSQNASPTDVGNATVNLSALLGQLGIAGATGPVIDSLGLEVGALASRIEANAGGDPVSEYRLTDLRANLHSALVAALATNLRTAGVTVGSGVTTGLNQVVGSGGAVPQALGAVQPVDVLGLARVSVGTPTIAVNVANLGAVVDTVLAANSVLVSDNQAVSVNLLTGTVSVNFAKILNPGGPNLNNLPANTQVLTPATVLAVTDAVSNALGKIAAPVTAAVTQAVANSTATVSLPVTATLLAGLGVPVKLIDAPITVSGTLAQLAAGTGTVDLSGIKLLPGINVCVGGVVLGVCVGDITTPLNGLVGATVSTVTTTVLPSLLGGISSGVAPLLTTTTGTVNTAVSAAVTPIAPALNTVLGGVLSNIAQVTINEQTDPGDLGADSTTVSALSVTLLPNVIGSRLAKVSLGSSTVLAEPAPTLNIVQTAVREGSDITVEGTDWDAASTVSVAFVDGAGNPVGAPQVVTPLPDGSYSFVRAIPTGTPGPVTATATQAGFAPTDSVLILGTPSANILETSVVPGGEINVVGANWDPAGPVSVVYTDGEGNDIGPAVEVPVGADGTFATTFTVPAGTVGPVTATVTQGTDEAEDTVAVAIAGEPAINIEETTVVAGNPITVRGSSWDPDPAQPVTVVFVDANGTQIGSPITPAVEADGSFVISPFVVPVSAVGSVTASATQTAGVTKQDTVIVTPAPNVDIVETTVVEGGTVNVTGTNWVPLTPLSIDYTDGLGAPIGSETPTTLADGSFATTFVVPVGTPGPVRATVVQSGTTDFDTVAVAAAPIPPSLDIVEPTVVAGQPVTVTGADWTEALVVTVEFRDSLGTVIGTQLTGVGADGGFSFPFTVPVGTTGPVTATATDGISTATDTVAVTAAPTVDVEQTEVVGGETIDVDGSNWTPSSNVSLVYTDADGTIVGGPVDVPADPSGLISTTFVVPVGTPGPLTVTASQGGLTAVDTVAVTAAPGVDVVETRVVAGDPITINGTGWNPASLVTVSFTDGNGDVVPGAFQIPPLADGSFSTSFTVPVGTVGPLTVRASQDGNAEVDTVVVDPAPSVNVVEDEVDEGDTITIEGEAWTPETDVTIEIRDGDGVVIATLPPLTTGTDGSFDTTYTVPVGTAGPVTVTVTQDDDTADDSVDIADAADGDTDVAADADADAVDADAVDADAVDADAVDADAVDADAVDADAVDADAVDADAVDADAVDADAVDADAVDADAVDADAVDADAVDADAVDADAVDADAVDADAVDADADAGPVTPAALPQATVERRTIVRGSGVDQRVFGIGFQPGETVSATVYSTPLALTPQVADANGNVTFSFRVGNDFELGLHRVEFIGAVSGDLPANRETTDFTVTGVATSALAYTGFDGMWLAGLAALLMLAGIGGIGVTRRRQHRVT